MDHVVVASGLTQRYGRTAALASVDLKVQAGRLIGLVGPDGVGKSTLLSLAAGARRMQEGNLQVLEGDMRDPLHRLAICPRVAYMPQGLGRNLYLTLSVFENVDFFGRLFGQDRAERQWRIDELLSSTGLAPFRDRPAGKLSGGMKQKLGLCCSLIHDPDLLILDEPTTGVDPLSRRQFWDLINRIRARRENMSVLVATAYMDEAQTFEHVIAMDAGNVLAEGSPADLMARTGTSDLDAAFIQLLPEERRAGHKALTVPQRVSEENAPLAISAKGLTQRFGDFTAVDHVTFNIERGEIFGFLGSNGCGKTTTMKMLTGLLPPTEGQAWISGTPAEANDIETRKRIGFMSQAFSLYRELSVRQNLELHARLFHLDPASIGPRVDELVQRFDLAAYLNHMPESIPLGIRQRLQLAVAVIHKPEILILDEPTSGVDPVARDTFWELLIDLSRREGLTTIFVSTHFMNEAARCDRISLMHSGKVLAVGAPAEIMKERNARSLEEAFIGYLEDAAAAAGTAEPEAAVPSPAAAPAPPKPTGLALSHAFNPKRVFAYAYREALELMRDHIRLVFAIFGTMLLMTTFGYGISLDVENLPFAVLDRDQSPQSRDYVYNISSSRYFQERPPIRDDAELERRMRDGELALVIEIPPRFGKDLLRGSSPKVAAWIDGSNPFRADTTRGYVQGLQGVYLRQMATEQGVRGTLPVNIESRFLYNQDFKSVVAMVPGVIALLLVLFPAMLTALGVVREKELGSITNLYVTPVTRLEFLLGKQVPYILLGMINYLTLVAMALLLFGVPLKGSFLGLSLAALLYVTAATGIGLLISAFTTSQIAAVFGTAIATMIPATTFCGLLDPVSSLQGGGRVIGETYPTTYFLKACVGAFTKGLSFEGLLPFITVLAIMAPLYTLVGLMFVRKQEP